LVSNDARPHPDPTPTLSPEERENKAALLLRSFNFFAVAALEVVCFEVRSTTGPDRIPKRRKPFLPLLGERGPG
jgi:hypothetical protein